MANNSTTNQTEGNHADQPIRSTITWSATAPRGMDLTEVRTIVTKIANQFSEMIGGHVEARRLETGEMGIIATIFAMQPGRFGPTYSPVLRGVAADKDLVDCAQILIEEIKKAKDPQLGARVYGAGEANRAVMLNDE